MTTTTLDLTICIWLESPSDHVFIEVKIHIVYFVTLGKLVSQIHQRNDFWKWSNLCEYMVDIYPGLFRHGYSIILCTP